MLVSHKKAFTLVELIFVIVIIGILTAIAVPKFQGVSEEAYISRAKSTVAALRSVIATERQKNILKGQAATAITNAEAKALLTYGLDSTSWSTSGSDTFTYTAPYDSSATCTFKINGGKLVKQAGCHADTGLNNL